jgi:hypothetical protein
VENFSEDLKMTKGLTWAAGSTVVVLGLMTVNGCVLNLGNGSSGGSGGSASTGTQGTGTGSGSYTTGTGVVPTPVPLSCDVDAKDDACTACQKASCCTEVTDCKGDASCEKGYNAYIDCLFPDGQNWSGYSAGYCKASARVDSDTTAGALVDCNVAQCDQECSALPQITYTNFVVDFMERNCNGCHFPGYGESGHLGSINTDDFSLDPTWDAPEWNGGAPLGNPDWRNLGNYDLVVARSELIWCGVSETLPSECDPTKFKTAQRIPPDGVTSSSHCWWTDDGQTCPQPTNVERGQMSSWIFDGMPE